MSIKVSREDVPVAVIRLEINNFHETVEMMDGIIAIVGKFDGKVLNARLENALKEYNNHLHVIRKYDRFSIEYMPPVDYVAIDHGDYCGAAYVTNRSIPVVGYMSTGKYDAENSPVNENNRIVSDRIIKSIEARKAEILNHISDLEKHVNVAEDNKRKLQQLKEEYNKLLHSIPYEVRKQFEIF